MAKIAEPRDYWIAPNAIYVTLNALGDHDRIQGNVASGAAILCYIKGVAGLEYDNGHNYQAWPLSLSPTYFGNSDKKYVYAAIPRTQEVSNQAIIVFPSEIIDIYGRSQETGDQIGSEDYYYIYLQGIISASVDEDEQSKEREWLQEIQTGLLSSDEALASLDTDWYSYSQITGVVTFLKQIRMNSGSKFVNLAAVDAYIEKIYLNGKGPLTGIAEKGKTKYDSTIDIVTPAYLDDFGNERYLSKTDDDTAAGVITFLRGLVAKGIITAEEGVQFGERFVPGYVGGQGGYIDKLGNGELESLIIRTFLEVPELRFNRISVYAGDQWQTNGGGIIERVEIDKDASGKELNTGTIWLKLEDGEAGTLAVNDKVKGIYHNLLGDNDTESTDDGRGNRTFKGFRTVYFVVTAVNSDEGKFNNRLSYELRPTTNGYWALDEGGSSGVRGGFHPQQSMSIAQYSNAADKSRQNSVYRTTRYTRMLRNMVGWDEHVYNIGMQFGATELLAQAATHSEPAAYDGLRERMRQADRYFMWIDGDIMFSGTLNRVDSWGRDMPDYPDQGTHIAGKQYFYNDLVHKDGVVWRCVYAEKDSDGNYLPCTSTPSENGDWEKWIYTDSLKASGHWQPGTYPVNAVVMLGNTAYISNKITSEPPVGLLTDKNGVYLKDNEGYYFIVNEETTDDWNVLIELGGITRGDDGESSVYITLTNDSDVLVTDSDGNVPAGTAYPSTMAQFYIGLSRILTGVVWSIDHTEGCSATIDAGGNVTTSNMTADRARVFINARYNDRDYQKIFGFRKSYGLTKYWLELSNDTVHFDPNTQAMSPRRILVHAYALTNGVKAAVTQASGLGRIVYNNNVIYDGDTITISREMFSDNHLILTLYDQPTTGGNVADAEDITFLEGGLNGQGIEDVGHWQSGRAYTHNEIAQLGNKRYIYYGDGSTTEPPVGLLLDKNGDYLVSRDGYYFPVTDECNEGWREFAADGLSITIERTEISYCATDSSERPSSGWNTQEPTVQEGQWLHVREIVVYSDGTITEKYSVSRAGIDGRGIQEANVFYAKSATELAMPEDDDKVTWYDLYSKMPSPVAGDWIWTKTVTTYSDWTKVTSYNCGLLGTDGNKYLSTEEFYALGVDNENAPAGWNHITEEGKYLPNDQWRTNRNFTEAEWKAKPYLWNIEISSYSDGTQSRTNPMCIGNFARGIDHFEELYAISASSIPGTGRQYPSDITNWDDEAQNAAPTDAKPYQWNKTVCYYNDSTTEEHYHVSAVKGTQGTAGQNAIRVDLDNENDTMLYSKGGQLLSGNVTSHAYLYDGATLVSSGVTFAIQSQTGCTASISGNTITVSAMSANAATVVVRATYKSKTYSTTLTLKKLVGVDRYEIVMSTTAANYNPNTKTVYPSTVNVEVYKTDSQGTRAKLTTLPTGFTLYLSNTAGSDGSAVTYASGKYSFSPVATNAEYIFTLKEGTVVHDRESMPVVMDGEDGKSITKKSEVKAYAVSSSATTTPTSWQTTKPTVAQNQYLWTRTTITWSDNSTTVLYQSERNPNDGANGMSIQIKSQTVTYCRRTAAQGPVNDPSTLTYGSYPSTLSKGDWLYSRTVVTYQTSGGASAGSTTSYSVSYIGTDGTNGQDGTNGADGRGITAITEYYAASASKTSAPATSAFKTTIPTDWNASKPYLWNYEKTDYSKAPLSESSTPAIIATYTENGRGVDSIVNHYLATSAGSGVTKSTSGWTATVQAITATKKYLWNYETITWIEKDGTTTTTETDPHIVGVYGDKGDQGPQGPQGPAGDGIDFAGHWISGKTFQKGDISTIGNNAYIANAPTTEPPVGLLTDKNGNYITSKDGGYFPVTDEVNSSWNLMLSGGQAVTIVTDITEYVIASQGETPPSSGWSQYRPATEQGKYLWERHTITFSEGTVNISYNISYMAVDGEDGDSITITQMAISYAVSQDGTTIPEEGWSDQMPTTKEGDYLYTRTVVRYSDGNQTVTFTKGYIGVNGETYYITASAPAVHVDADGVPTPAADEQIQTVVKSTVTAWKHVAGKDDVQVPVVWEGVDQSPYGTSSQVFVQFATDQQRIVNAYEQVQQSGSATPQKGRLLAQFVITVTKDGANGKAGQGIVTSFVFKRAATKPTLPAATAGSFSSPVPTGWSDGIPAGTTPIWSTSRIFTSDGKSPQQSAWSPVRLMADTESYDVEFAKATADGKQPPAPTSANSIKGDTSANKIWYDPTEIDETTIKSEDMVWMAQRSRYVNESGNPVWSSWIISRIKGEQGPAGDGIDFAGHWISGKTFQKGDIATIGNNAYIANAPTTEPPVGLLTDKNGNYITSKDGGYFPVTDEVNSSWNLMLSGGQAVTIVTDITEYVIASQGETPPSSGWSQYRPATEQGKYLWERHTITFSEGTVNISYNISYMAVDGEDGDSITITQMAISYAVSQDGTTIPEEGWSDQMPTTKEGDYLYTRTVVRYSDGNQTVTYTKGYIGKNGQGVVTSVVFKRAATKPALPAATAGSFSSPVPTGWSDGIPAGTTPIWSTSRIFTSDGKSPQQSAWSPVRLMADTESYDVEFAKATADGKQPPAPTSANSIKGDTSANKIWYDPTEIDETTIKSEDMVWMAQRSRYVNESGNPVWSSWIISRIKGEQGDTGKDAIVYDIVTDLDSLEAYTSQLTVSIRKTVGGTSQTFYINPDTAYATDGLILSFAGALASKAQLRMGSPSLVYLTNSPHANGSSLILRLTKGGVQVAEKEIRASYVTQYLMTVSPSQINVDAGGQFMSNTDKKIVVHVLKMLGNSDPVVVTQSDGLEVYIKAKYNETQNYPDSTGKVELALDLRDTAKGSDGSRQPVTVELQTSEGSVINKMTIPIVSSGAQGLQGCSTRVSEFKANTAYVNQDGINMEGGDLSVGYIDVVAVEMPKDDARYEASDGYFWYMCMVPSTADYGYLAPANGQDTWYHSGQSDQKLVWKALSAIGPSFFSLLIAKNAWIKFGSGNQFVIQDSDGNIVAGLTGYIPDADNEDRSVRIWAGGEDPALSPFRVLQSGDFYAEKAHIRGLVEVRDANEGLIVYDSQGNACVQVVANEVEEPVNDILSFRRAEQAEYYPKDDTEFTLVSSMTFQLGQLKADSMLTVNGLYVTPSLNAGTIHLKLTNRSGKAERMTVSVTLEDTNGNTIGTNDSTYSATNDTLIEDISFAFQGFRISETKNYNLVVGVKVANINTGNTDSDTFGGITTGTQVTSTVSLSANHATPKGTRIGTNGIFVNLGENKSFSVKENYTEIKYLNSRLRVNTNGVYLYDGQDYVPVVKKTKTITANYVVQKEDGVLVLRSSSRITLTLRSTSSSEFKVICQDCPGYDIDGQAVYKFNNSALVTPWSSDDKRPRMFVSDGVSSWYEFYGGN